MRSRARDHVTVDNGECLSKMPAASADQLNIAKILSKPGDEVDLRKYVSQLRELTECTEDQAVTALYDCENNLERAVELLLDKLRFGTDEEWYTTGKKQTRTKQALTNGQQVAESVSPIQGDHISEKSVLHRTDAPSREDKDVAKSDTSEVSFKKWDNRRRGSSGVPKSGTTVDYNSRRPDMPDSKPQSTTSEPREVKPQHRLPRSDAWDPYTEYGGWGGEAIEVINSNASISRTLQEDVLPTELLVDTEVHEAKTASDQTAESNAPSVKGDFSPQSINATDPDSIFVTRAYSKPPPNAFTNFPDKAVFVPPELIPPTPSKWSFKFCGQTFNSFRNAPVSSESTVPLSPEERVVRSPQAAQSCAKGSTEPEHHEYSFSRPTSSPRPKTANFEPSESSGHSRSLLENVSQPDSKPLATNTYTSGQFQNTGIAPKLGSNYSGPSKPQPTASFGAEATNGQPNFLESSLKSYILDNLPKEMSKLSAGESPHSKVSQFNMQPQVPQTQVSASSFSSNQGSTATTAHSVNKSQTSHLPSHGSMHTSQQPNVSTASQTHQQQATSVPPGMPHFIGQFAPQAYMFNLPGNSGNTPAIFDLDQFQLLQQQRMFYDMHLQQQAATTAQSLLTSTADASTTSKSTTHSMPGAMGHVTAANAAGLRPDVLASAMGHAPQMMPTGHPYFSYPGFVLMNGYSNAFLNQQQQQSGQDGSQSQGGSNHGAAPITQHQQQTNNPAQSYSAMKSVNSNLQGYDDLFDMKYGDPTKQVGFKNTGNYGSFQSAANEGPKMSTNAASSGVLTQGFNTNSGQTFSPQFYPPYLTAAAMAVAAAAAASSQQQQTHGGNASQQNAPMNNSGSGAGPNGMHQPNSAAQAMVMGASASNMHHQRTVMPQQY